MQFAFDVTQAGIVIFGIVVAIAAVLGPFAEIFLAIFKYVQKLFAGPIKTEPLANTKSRKT